MKKVNKVIKTIIIFNFFLFVGLGIYSSTLQKTEQPNVKEIIYSQLWDLAKEHKDEAKTLTQKQNGDVVLQIKGDDTAYTASVPAQNEIAKLVKDYRMEYKVEKEQKSFASLLSTFLTYLIPIAVIIFIFSIFSSQKKVMGKADSMAKANSKKNAIPDVKRSDIGGISPETNAEIDQMIEVFQQAEEAEKFGIRPLKGTVLYGPPGTGKTLLAKGIANQLQASFFTMSGSSFVEMYVGVGAARVRKLFEEARKAAPSLIFIDEIDAVAGKRGNGNQRNEEREATLNEFLTQLDGMNSNEQVLVVAATNRLDMLDEAFLRPGRFDLKIKIDLPDLEGRKEIIHIHSAKKPLSNEVRERIEDIAKMTYGQSGADIEALFLTAANHAFSLKKQEIDMEDIHHAYDRMLLGSSGRKIDKEQTKERVAYHEAGHALVGAIVNPGSIRKATIVPRGDALGFVAQLPQEMQLQTKSQLVDRIKMILAGGVAEMKIFGEHSVGVGGDVQQAKQLIEHMVEVGMGDGDFVLSFTEKEKQEKMKNIYQEALEGCKQIIDTHIDVFKNLTRTLLEKETIDGREVEEIIFGTSEPVEETTVTLEKTHEA